MEIAAMASSSSRPPSSSYSSLVPTPNSTTSPHAFTTTTTFCKPKRPPHISSSLPISTISLLSLFAPPNEARAAITIQKEQILSSLTQVEQTIDQVQEVGSGFLDTAHRVAEAVGNVLKPVIDTASPILQQAWEEAFKFASPAFSEASNKATQPVFSTAKTVADAAQQTTKVIEGARTIASSTVETITSSDPTVIAETAGALFIAYLVFPPIWSALSFNLRGYKGGITPAQTLDMLCAQNYILIDIRSEKDKDKAGIPLVLKTRFLPFQLPSKLKGLVRNVKKVEAEIAALKISYLKKINKGTNIVILDSYSDSAKIVARTLTGFGYNNTWIVADGFSGGKGWLQSRLGTDSYKFSFA